ncbi:MAG: hypothetical protein M3Y58_12730 [Chloroflexota bacterium]|nr:hypothetical protein [Chloroflexota bacterium]
MQRARFPWSLSIAILVAALLSISTTAVTADTAGATLHASGETVSINKRDETKFIPSNIENGGSEDFVGTGFGPGEVVSLFLTFPDGRVFPVMDNEGTDCCPQTDETLADTTGGIHFEILFDQFQNYPTTTGSATDGTQFTNNIFTLPAEFATGAIPYGSYTVTAIGRVSLQKATSTIKIIPPSGPDFVDGSTTSTGTLAVYTTIGHRTSSKQVDPGLSPTGVVDNPNVDIACNGMIPGEFVTFWDTYPDGSVVSLSTLTADDGGGAVLQLDLLTGKFPTGLHTFSCRGNQSNYVMTGSFLVLPGGISSQSSIGTLTASFVGAPQAVANATFPQLPSFFASDYLLLTARDFRPNETVTFWQTFPDQTAHFLATVKANEAGAAVVVIQLFPGPINYQAGKAILGDAALYQIAYPAGVDGRIPVGRQYFSARGDSTQRTASYPFDLIASQAG